MIFHLNTRSNCCQKKEEEEEDRIALYAFSLIYLFIYLLYINYYYILLIHIIENAKVLF